MNKDQAKALLEEYRGQLYGLSYEKYLLDTKLGEVADKMKEINGMVAVLEYVEKAMPKVEAVTPEVPAA